MSIQPPGAGLNPSATNLRPSHIRITMKLLITTLAIHITITQSGIAFARQTKNPFTYTYVTSSYTCRGSGGNVRSVHIYSQVFGFCPEDGQTATEIAHNQSESYKHAAQGLCAGTLLPGELVAGYLYRGSNSPISSEKDRHDDIALAVRNRVPTGSFFVVVPYSAKCR